MKVLDRYVAWTFAVSAFVAFTFVLCLYVMVHFFANLDELGDAQNALATRGIGLFTGLCRYYAVTMPFILTKLGPFAVLLAAMWTLQKMSRDQEIVAAQVAGVSLHRFVLPVLVGGLLLAVGLSFVRQDLLPKLATESHELERFLRGKKEAVIDGPLLVKDKAGNPVLMQTYEPAARVARGVHFRTADLSRSLDVGAMRYDPESGTWEALGADGGTGPLGWETELEPRDIEIDARGLRYLGGDELDELSRRMPGRLDLELMRQTRFTYPLTTVVLLLLGIPMVLRRDQQSVYAAWGLCLLVSILYFGVENVLHGLAERDKVLNPALAAWIPIAVFGVGGALTFQDL